MSRLMIMAAGTGGHIFPGLAIAETMRERGWQVSWLGTTHGMEGGLVPKHGIELDRISFAGVRGKGLLHTARGLVRLVTSFFTCWRLHGRRRPDVVLGMGGYVTVPGGVSARLRGVPLVLVNADAGLLMSNKTLAPMATKVLFGFPSEASKAADNRCVTGNPVRADILSLPRPEERYAAHSGPLRILVVGGSLGARILNESVPAALALLAPDQRPIVTHQSGKQHIEDLRAAYRAAGVEAECVDFIDDMARRYAEADLVICRAGAITVSELTAAGVASVLVPFLASTTTHQRDNAAWLASQAAAIHLPQQELTPQRLAQMLGGMTRSDCLNMAQHARACGQREANRAIADILEQCVAARKPS